MIKKTILFGGTFDPIHLGHTTVAASALAQIGAAKVVFIPANRSPHKQVFPIADGRVRLEMLSLAIAGNDRFEVSDCELKRTGPSYTLDTVKFFSSHAAGKVEIYWLMGTDAISDLAKWYEIKTLVDECHLCLMRRGGYDLPDLSGLEEVLGAERVKKLKNDMISTPLIEVSSTEIREKIARGISIADLVAPGVRAYIEKNGVYA